MRECNKNHIKMNFVELLPVQWSRIKFSNPLNRVNSFIFMLSLTHCFQTTAIKLVDSLLSFRTIGVCEDNTISWHLKC